MRNFAVFYPLLAMILGCGPINYGSMPAVLIGDHTLSRVSDLERDSLPEGLSRLFSAVGKTSRDCSVFHVGDGLAITAGHCFTNHVNQVDRNSCHELHITWGGEAQISSRCLRILHHRYDEDHDIALIRVDPIPDTDVAIDYQVAEGTEIGLLGFAQDEELSIASGCFVTESELSRESTRLFSHRCDSLRGHSGGLLFDLQTFSAVGVHNGGRGNWNYGSHLIADEISAARALLRVGDIEPGQWQSLGPFGHNERRVLAAVPSSLGDKVSLDLLYELDRGYDFLYVTDGSGHIRSMTGSDTRSLLELATPVILSFSSDYAGISERVEVALHAEP